MPSKSLFASKTFWFNVLTFGGTIAGILPVKLSAIAVPLVNLGLRIVTNQAVTLNIPFKD